MTEKYSANNLLFILIPFLLAVVCLYYAVLPLTNLISPQFTTVVGTKINEYSAGTGRDYTDNWYIKIADRTIEGDNGVQNFSTWIEKVNIGDKCKITYSARTKYLLSAEDLSKKQ
jgi:cytochrome c oxidase assembly protein Cox11